MADRPLYVILESSADATPEELRRAYHRLALQYHPDRAGPESAEKFQQILAAYSLLSDPEAREVYDKYGEQGLSNMEAMPAMQEVGLTMSSFNFFRVAFALIAFVSVNGIVLFGLVSEKIDGNAGYSWHMAVCPGYVVFATFSLFVIASIAARIKRYYRLYKKQHCRRSDAEEDDEPRSPTAELFEDLMKPNNRTQRMKEMNFWMRHFISLSAVLTGFLLIATVAQRERGISSFSWWAAFGPMLLSGIVSYSTAFVYRDLLHLAGIHNVTTFGLVTLNTLSLLMITVRIVEVLLVVCLLEGYFTAEAYLVALPAEIYLVLACTYLLFAAYYRQKGIEKVTREMPYMSEEDRKEIQELSPYQPNYWIEVLLFTFTFTCFLLGTIVTTLTPIIGNKYQLAFIPFFVYFGVMLLASVILFASVANEVKRRSSNVPDDAASSDEDRANISDNEVETKNPNFTGEEAPSRPTFTPTNASKARNAASGGSRRTRLPSHGSNENDSQGESYPRKLGSAPMRTTVNSELRPGSRAEFEIECNGLCSDHQNSNDESGQAIRVSADFGFEYVE